MIQGWISIDKVGELDRLIVENEKNESKCFATSLELRRAAIGSARSNKSIVQFLIENCPSLDDNGKKNVGNYLLDKMFQNQNDLYLAQARESKSFGAIIKKRPDLVVNSDEYNTTLNEVKAGMMKKKVEINFETILAS